MSSSSIPSILDLEQQLEALKRQEAERLQAEIEGVRDRLDLMEQRVRVLLGEKPPKPERQTLKEAVESVLSCSNEALTAAQIAELVIDSGYSSRSRDAEKNMPNMVQQCLARHPECFRRATRRTKPIRYRLVEWDSKTD